MRSPFPAATPSEARSGRNAAAIGFGVGAIAGAAIAGSAYNNGYYAPMSTVTARVTGYAYAPAYTYGGYGYDSPWLDPHRTNNFSISSQR